MTEENKIEVVYTGERRTDKNKLASFFVPLETARELTTAEAYANHSRGSSARRKLCYTVGGIYKVTGEIEDGKMKSFCGDFSYTGKQIDDATIITGLKLMERRAVTDVERIRLDKVHSKEDEVTRLVAKLREHHNSINPMHRFAFKMWIWEELSKVKVNKK